MTESKLQPDRAGIVRELVAKGARADRAVMYSDLVLSYREAARNISANGQIVAHPRTGLPLENPYLRVRDAAMRELARFKGLGCDPSFLWVEVDGAADSA